MNNIKDFRKVIVYDGKGRKLTKEELKPLGLDGDVYESLDERAYQAAYDISNDWEKESPEWKDVEEGFKRGVKEGIEYVNARVMEQIEFYKQFSDIPAVEHRIQELENINSFINGILNEQ